MTSRVHSISEPVDTTRSIFDLLGGEPGVRALVDRFYDLMDIEPDLKELRAAHGPSLDEARDKLFWFLCGYFGGPDHYIERFGHPRLRARHLPFSIGEVERDQWVTCMGRALEDEGIEPALVDRLLESFTAWLTGCGIGDPRSSRASPGACLRTGKAGSAASRWGETVDGVKPVSCVGSWLFCESLFILRWPDNEETHQRSVRTGAGNARGAARQAPGTAILGDEHVLVRSDLPAAERRPVAVISGGGSGHEPAHAGYVGDGMLSAAVCGEVFTSPSTDAVLAAIRATAGPNGALLIVKNYTGDRLNFGLAAELARAEGIPVEIAIVADDVAAPAHAARTPPGIAGTVLVHKIAGAAAAAGLPDAVAEAARAAQLGSMGVALGGCTCRARKSPASRWPTTRSSWAWASTARRASSAAPCCRPTS